MSTPYEIPLQAAPQSLQIALAGITYTLQVRYDYTFGAWILDIEDATGSPLLMGIPLVTGCDLLEQYAYMEFGGALYVQTDGDVDALPTPSNLGSNSHLYFVVP